MYVCELTSTNTTGAVRINKFIPSAVADILLQTEDFHFRIIAANRK